MPIQIYNTLTRTKEPLETLEPGVVKLYVCGVTVYDQAHIGHAMSATLDGPWTRVGDGTSIRCTVSPRRSSRPGSSTMPTRTTRSCWACAP